jgi:3-oxoacyl-[acyl-carrier protein] reductase
VDLGLAGRVALITGAHRGTGVGIAHALAEEGATVLVQGHEPGQAEPIVRDVEAAGGRALALAGDVRTEHGAAALVDAVRAVVPRVDILVNNYGVPEGSDWDASDTTSWHVSYEHNVVSAVRLVQAFVPDMRAAGWGRIVFLATVGATRPGDRIPEYYAAKGALPAVTVSLAKHLAGSGITVNCVSPGVIATAEVMEGAAARLAKVGAADDWPAVEQEILRRMGNPTGRVPQPLDVGRFVAFVASEPAWHLNGAHLRFDGGAVEVVT